MCGIIGCITIQNNIQKILINNLKKLEYRGYDSSGLCIVNNNNFYVKKSLGQIKNLEDKIDQTQSNIGIAHTRWATCGAVCLNNTHPLVGQNKTWAVVHNGIIENYLKIKKQLTSINFCGDTDTEIIPNFLELQKNTNNLKKIQNLTKNIVGSYAICLLNKDEPNTMYLVRKDSPLFVAKNSSTVLASSDPSCFAENFKTYYTLPQNTIAKLTLDSLEFFDFDLNKIDVKQKKIGVFEKSSLLGKYKYFAEKEINQIPKVLQNISKAYYEQDYFCKLDKTFLHDIFNIKLIGCGTSYHACFMGAKYLQSICKIQSSAHIASEFRYSNPIINNHTLCVFVSQSGETADTILCQELCKNMGAKTISVVNVPYSTLAQNSDVYLPLCAGMEIAVVSTKAYNAMLYVLYLLANHIKCVLKDLPKDQTLLNQTLCYAKKSICFKNSKQIDELASLVLSHKKIFFIGKDQDYITALEAGLKLKEITYINCISIASGELKHGTLSLVDNDSVVFVICTNQNLLSKNLASADEIKSRGGKVVLVTNLNIKKTDTKNIDKIFKFAKCPNHLASNLAIIPFQMLAYKVCLSLGNNPDKPKNLAKSVTVE